MPLRIPANLVRSVRGALLLLTDESNWEPVGSATPTECAAAMLSAWFDMVESENACMIGAIVAYATTVIPAGLLPCDGTYYDKDDYLDLYNRLPASLKDENGFTTPDLQGQFIFGADGSHTPLSTGGSATHTLSIGEIPVHSHSEVAAVSTLINGGLEAPASAAVPLGGVTGTAGGGNAHNNMPPYTALNYGIAWR